MKGRHSGTITIRLPEEIIAGIHSYLKEGETVGVWVRDLVVHSVHTMDLGVETGSQI